jgi:hypothetical protein
LPRLYLEWLIFTSYDQPEILICREVILEFEDRDLISFIKLRQRSILFYFKVVQHRINYSWNNWKTYMVYLWYKEMRNSLIVFHIIFLIIHSYFQAALVVSTSHTCYKHLNLKISSLVLLTTLQVFNSTCWVATILKNTDNRVFPS